MARNISELIKSFAPERQAAIEADANEIATEMIATADSLKNRKGYGGKT